MLYLCDYFSSRGCAFCITAAESSATCLTLHVHYRKKWTRLPVLFKQSLSTFFSYWAVSGTLSTVSSRHREILHNTLMPFVLATDFQKQLSLFFRCKKCRHCTSKPRADVTPSSTFLILWKIKPDVNCFLWQRISGAQLGESSPPFPLSLLPELR